MMKHLLLFLAFAGAAFAQVDPSFQDNQLTDGNPFGLALFATDPAAALGSKINYTGWNLDATTNPGVNDDAAAGYMPGSLWFNTTGPTIWRCVDGTDGAAVWIETSGGGSLATEDIDTLAELNAILTDATLVDSPLISTAIDTLAELNAIVADATLFDAPANASQVEMEAGTETAIRQMSPLRVAQAIAALVGDDYDVHAADDANPHNVTALQVGAVPWNDAAVDPTVNDDIDNFTEGTVWRNNQGTSSEADDEFWQLLDDTDGAAVWVPMLRLDAAGELTLGTVNATTIEATDIEFSTDLDFTRTTGGYIWRLNSTAWYTTNAHRQIQLGQSGARWGSTWLGNNLTGSLDTPSLSIDSIWNTTGTPTLLEANVTDTASNAASLLLDLQVGASSQFSVSKDGTVQTSQGAIEPEICFPLTIDDVADSMDYGAIRVNAAFTISEVVAYHVGTGLSSPDIDIDIRHSTDRSAAGNQLDTAAMTVTSSTTGNTFNSGFEDATVPADSVIWIETSSQSGTTDNLEIFIYGTYD